MSPFAVLVFKISIFPGIVTFFFAITQLSSKSRRQTCDNGHFGVRILFLIRPKKLSNLKAVIRLKLQSIDFTSSATCIRW